MIVVAAAVAAAAAAAPPAVLEASREVGDFGAELSFGGVALHGVLGVPVDADQQAVRSAYKKLLLQWHPDKHGQKGTRNPSG